MRLMTANTAGTIQAADTIIQGRRRGNRTVPQYRWSTARRNTVYVNTAAARVFVVESGPQKGT
jgi:hypothetical protein